MVELETQEVELQEVRQVLRNLVGAAMLEDQLVEHKVEEVLVVVTLVEEVLLANKVLEEGLEKKAAEMKGLVHREDNLADLAVVHLLVEAMRNLNRNVGIGKLKRL